MCAVLWWRHHAPQRPSLVLVVLPPPHTLRSAPAVPSLSLTLALPPPPQLWLMHSPSGGDVVETWRAMLEARDAGKVRACGVSNFGHEQIARLAAAGLELPEVNQIELHCWNHQRPTVAYCAAHQIVVMA